MGTMEETCSLPFQETGPSGSGMATLLCIIAATALLVYDADKLTYGQRLLVYTPHAIESFKATRGK